MFLREIAKRLIEGLKEEIPDLQKRIDHIFHKQLYGIAITELTSLLSRRSVYCSKYPNSKYSISLFDDSSGNIRYKRVPHRWQNGKCVFCGASQKEYERGDELETHAYEWIHTIKPEEIFKMKFDVIIGNPPYQLSDGGAQASATPIYNRFVEQAKKLNPRYMTMIIPARWYAGGKGLDTFRASMVMDRRIRVLHDFINASDCFGNGVEIKGGICFFLWDRDHVGKCKVFTHTGDKTVEQNERYLQEDGNDVFIRYAEGVSILGKVQSANEKTMDEMVSSQKPFGLRTYVHGEQKRFAGSIKLYERGGTGYVNRGEITKNENWIDQPKVFISAAYNAGDSIPHQIIGKPIAGEAGSACTETYIVVGPFNAPFEVNNAISYIQTKFFRFLVMLRKSSQHAASSVYAFVPQQDFSKPWTDTELYKKYGLTDDEIAFIESMIKPMELGGDDNGH